MFKKPKPINYWDFPDTIQIPNGYDMKDIPDLTRDNLEYLTRKHNELVEIVLQILNTKEDKHA